MGLFKKNYNKPGPGVPKNAPRKKGFARFFEILGRDFGNFVKLNFIFQLCVLLPEAFLLLSILSLFTGAGYGMLLFGVLAFVASIPFGPACTAVYYIISKTMRDDPGFLWQDFKRVFKENFRATVLPGMVFSLIIGAQVYGVIYFILAGQNVGIPAMALFMFSSLIFMIAFPYFFLQSAYLDLKTGPKLQNSLLLAVGNAPRSFMGALLGGIPVVLQAVFFPVPLLFTVVIGYTIPCFMGLMWVWPVVDKTFSIEKTLKERHEKEVDAFMQTPPED